MAKRGLASASEDTRKRVARMGGIARGQSMRNVDRGFFSEIGRKGGKAKNDPAPTQVDDWGKEY